MGRDADALMWERRKCPGCGTRISVPRELPPEATRLCLPCQSWQRTERARVKQGLPPAIENSLGPDPDRDAAALRLLDLYSAPSAPESLYTEPRKPPAQDQPHEFDEEMYGWA